MLEFLTLVEHAALYLSLPVLCIWSLVRGSPETKFAIWGVMSQYYVANFLKAIFHMSDNSEIMRAFSALVDVATVIVIMKSGKSIFLLIFSANTALTWIASATLWLNKGQMFWSSMFTSEFFTWLAHSCFALALLSDDRFPNAHWREVAKLVRVWE